MSNRETPDLQNVIEWAQYRIREMNDPPFVYYRLMQIIEASRELLPITTINEQDVEPPQKAPIPKTSENNVIRLKTGDEG